MKRGIFNRIFILYAAILLLAAAGTELYVTGAVREDRISSLRENLAVQAELIARDIPFRHPVPLDPLCKRFKSMTRARVTVIAADGRVLGDSDHDSSTMENHGGRIEVRQADLTGVGMVIRHSDTLGYNLLYVAKKVTRDGSPEGFVRLSVPLQDLDASVNRLRVRLISSVIAILLASGLFLFWQIERLRRFTVQIRDFATAVAKGDLGRRLFLGQAGEFDEIAESLTTMSTELKQTIGASEEERSRLAVILSSIPDALLIGDASGVIRITSAASRKFFGDVPLRGRQFIEIVRNREFLDLLDEVRQDRLSGVVEFRLDEPEERYVIARVSPLSYREGELSGLVVIFHDITQLKKLEQVRKDFVANISHEIRTPITAIQGFADTLLDGALDDRDNARKFVETIRANSLRINSLVDDLMTISKLELGVLTVEKAPVVFEDIAEAVLALFKDKAAKKGLSLGAVVPPDLGTIEADHDRLIQVLTNLVDNAIKFTDSGGVTFGIAEESGRTFLFVEDTGIGVPEKHLSRLGERFYRVDTARSRKMGGTGLGLAIVKHLVKAHGWEMRITSTVGKGTTVRIYFA